MLRNLLQKHLGPKWGLCAAAESIVPVLTFINTGVQDCNAV